MSHMPFWADIDTEITKVAVLFYAAKLYFLTSVIEVYQIQVQRDLLSKCCISQ